MSFDLALTCLPSGWAFSHLMALEPTGFQCNLINHEDRCMVIGTGDFPAEAVAAASVATYNAKNFLALYVPGDHMAADAPLRNSLDIAKLFLRREPIDRRI